jgi:hypothetical protein
MEFSAEQQLSIVFQGAEVLTNESRLGKLWVTAWELKIVSKYLLT